MVKYLAKNEIISFTLASMTLPICLPFTHRASGIIGAAFDSKNCTVELIYDRIHIDGCVVRATFQLFTDEKVILISDSIWRRVFLMEITN